MLEGCGDYSSPNSVVEHYARSIVNYDLRNTLSCIEGGEDILELFSDSEEIENLEYLMITIQEARRNGLVPNMDYRIISENIQEDYGTFQVEFIVETLYGEHEGTRKFTQEIPVYKYNGIWWIGDEHPETELKALDVVKSVTSFYGSL